MKMIFLLYSLLTAGRGSHGGRRVSGTDLPEASKGGGGLSVWARNLEDPEQKVRMNTTPFRELLSLDLKMIFFLPRQARGKDEETLTNGDVFSAGGHGTAFPQRQHDRVRHAD